MLQNNDPANCLEENSAASFWCLLPTMATDIIGCTAMLYHYHIVIIGPFTYILVCIFCGFSQFELDGPISWTWWTWLLVLRDLRLVSQWIYVLILIDLYFELYESMSSLWWTYISMYPSRLTHILDIMVLSWLWWTYLLILMDLCIHLDGPMTYVLISMDLCIDLNDLTHVLNVMDLYNSFSLIVIHGPMSWL